MATDEEIQHLKELLDIYQDRFHILDKQRAHYGRGRIPAELALDIQEVEESIARINAKLKLVSVPQEIVDATGPEAGIDVLRHEVKELKEKFNTAMRWMEANLLEMREEARQWRAGQEVKHKVGARRQYLILGLIVLIFVLIAFIMGRIN